MGFSKDIATGVLMQQISDMLAMDHLTNNWDRFSGDPALYGANCHLEPGGLVAIDNGASFPPWNADRVVRRLKLSQRFTKSFVLALRRLEYEKTIERLFPDANFEEEKRFEIFWQRRDELLAYIDGLIAVYGEDAVLFF